MEINVIKRDGDTQEYEQRKIFSAMKKCFNEKNIDISKNELNLMVFRVEDYMKTKSENNWNVEDIQDTVEKVLMDNKYYDVAKAYILYRQKRTDIRDARLAILDVVHIHILDYTLWKIQKDFPEDKYSMVILKSKFLSFIKDGMDVDECLDMLIKAAIELTTKESPKWEYIAARILYCKFLRESNKEYYKHDINSFYDKLRYWTDKGWYGEYILSSYTKEEIDILDDYIDDLKTELFTYSGLDLLLKRYVIQNYKRVPLESPQEMFMGIAMHLAMNEPVDRMKWVKKIYDMLSNMRITLATPTMSNARKPYHQLSSCFIDTVPDDLDGIYRSITNFSQVSKFGGGMGLYFGKVRATGSPIRGFENASGGVIRWIKLVNDTAIAVDQLGMRQGAVAVYLDVWHKDIMDFLQLRTNNGDDRMKAHDVFPAVCYPDLFWKMARCDLNKDWHLFCPHEILTVKGYSLEDYHGKEWERRYNECVKDTRISRTTVKIKDLVRLIIKSAVETGTPFVFNRDIVNYYNTNPHAGMIYCSNLCTEIAQNMSAIENVSTEIKTDDGDTVIINTTRPGDFVVCNLASIALGNFNVNDKYLLEDTIRTAVRVLDNVIDLNSYPLAYAKYTNNRYRSIGLGVSGYHHMLAKNKIVWESEDHLKFSNEIFEEINYYAIKASNELAKERGSYPLFKDSEWDTGEYFIKRHYISKSNLDNRKNKWAELRDSIKEYGIRNGYLLAIAPTSSTSIICGTTAGIDPVMNKFFLEEKKGVMLPRVSPDLNDETYWYYKTAHTIDQYWSIRACGTRQRHIDQAQSMNLYITNDFTLREVLNLYISAWESGIKTIYYVRSKSLDIEECESCAS